MIMEGHGERRRNDTTTFPLLLLSPLPWRRRWESGGSGGVEGEKEDEEKEDQDPEEFFSLQA
eukprot:417909-Pyramimonas_sp.AAC.1